MSNRPVFTGQRLTVFGWQVQQLESMLGPYSKAFDVIEWLFDFDKALSSRLEVMPPQRQQHQLLEAGLIAEARRRGLPIAENVQLGKLSSRMAQAVRNLGGKE